MTVLYGKSAADILHETGQENNIHVSLNEILRHYRISAKAMDFTDLENFMRIWEFSEGNHIIGLMVSDPSGAVTIFYSNGPEFMQNYECRFIVARELAFQCLTDKPAHIKLKYDDHPEDERANIFAGELLLPLHQLEIVSKELLLPTIQNLSRVFEVPEAVIVERLKHLKREDLAVWGLPRGLPLIPSPHTYLKNNQSCSRKGEKAGAAVRLCRGRGGHGRTRPLKSDLIFANPRFLNERRGFFVLQDAGILGVGDGIGVCMECETQ